VTEKQNGEWYSNKEIFEQLQKFKEDFINLGQDLTREMYDMREEITETKMLIKEYNGLRKEIQETKAMITRCQIETPAKVQKEMQEELKDSKKKITELENKITELRSAITTLKWVFGGLATIASIIIGILQYYK
jgi:chromosome segregation ATPase